MADTTTAGCRHQLLTGKRRGEFCDKPVTSNDRCSKHQSSAKEAVASTTTPIPESSTSNNKHAIIYGKQCCYLFAKGDRRGLFCGTTLSDATTEVYCYKCQQKKNARVCPIVGCRNESPNTRLYCINHSNYEPENNIELTPEQVVTNATNGMDLSIPSTTDSAVSEGRTTRSKIPAAVRADVWCRYVGNKVYGECYCCGGHITSFNFHAGHVIADARGGSSTVDNLRPLCQTCNLSMGTTHMGQFIRTYRMRGPGAAEWPVEDNHNTNISHAPSVIASSSRPRSFSASTPREYGDASNNATYHYDLPMPGANSKRNNPSTSHVSSSHATPSYTTPSHPATAYATSSRSTAAYATSSRSTAANRNTNNGNRRSVPAQTSTTAPILTNILGRAIISIAPAAGINANDINNLLAQLQLSAPSDEKARPSSSRRR